MSRTKNIRDATIKLRPLARRLNVSFAFYVAPSSAAFRSQTRCNSRANHIVTRYTPTFPSCMELVYPTCCPARATDLWGPIGYFRDPRGDVKSPCDFLFFFLVRGSAGLRTRDGAIAASPGWPEMVTPKPENASTAGRELRPKHHGRHRDTFGGPC